MGATSSTGVGIGGAWHNKGPGNGREQYVALVSPHIVASGIVATTGWKTTVTFPQALLGTPEKYVIMLMQSDSTNRSRGSSPTC